MKRAVLSLLALFATPVLANDMALIISNPNTSGRDDYRSIAISHEKIVESYLQKGYRVFEGEGINLERMRELLVQLETAMDEDSEGRVVLHFTGNAVSFGDQVFLVPDDVDTQKTLGLTLKTIPLGTLISLAKAREDNGAVVLGIAPSPRRALSDHPADLSALTFPEDILAIYGPHRAVTDAVRDDLLKDGKDVAEVAERRQNVRFTGRATPGTRLVGSTPGGGSSAEETMWSLASESRSELMIRAYLERFPNGAHADEARRLLEANPGQLDEEALQLNRGERREIQRKLTVLGFDTRGIDGIFGRGTRAAIQKWQRSTRFEPTGYLTAPQLRRLDRDVEIRQAEIREEERRARFADDDYWSRTGASYLEDDLRRYLDKYPNGAHAKEAKDELKRIEDARLSRAEREDRDAWNAAKDANTIEAFESYIRRFPQGRYVSNARERIENKRGRDTSRLLAEERALGLNGASIAVLELRLATMGYNVGSADGKITDQTRRAIASYQKRANLPSTGYLNKATVQKLLLSGF
ncbi:peptidoglycan-binding domain-containing protein [Halovulum sp. GXIMD14793]